MKQLFTFLLVAISATCFAQGNLQFNQVINLSGVAPTSNIITSVTVPVGKVWKITSASWRTSNGGGPVRMLCLDYNTIYRNGAGNRAIFPIWLQAGTYDVSWCGSSTTVSGNRYAISAIEFNVVP